MVAESFIGSIKGKVINHKNFNKSDNNVSNLEICSQNQNIQYSVDAGHIKPPRRLDPDNLQLALNVCDQLISGTGTFEDIAESCNCSERYVRDLYKRKVRQNLTKHMKFRPISELTVNNDLVRKICDILESEIGVNDDEIAARCGTSSKIVEGVRTGKYRRDFTQGKVMKVTEKLDLLPGEDFKRVKYYGKIGKLYITNFGRVFELDGTEKTQKVSNDGFLYVNCRFIDGTYSPISVHITVAEAFIANPNNYSNVKFIDGNKMNCRYDNLKWVSTHERYSTVSKTYSDDDTHVTDADVHEVCKLLLAGKTNTYIANHTNVSKYMVRQIRKKESFNYISDQYFKTPVCHTDKHGRSMKGQYKFSDEVILDILRRKNNGEDSKDIAAKYDTSKEYVNKIWRGVVRPELHEKFMKDRPLVIYLGRSKHSKRAKTNW